ncbi:MAG: TRAP transporter large permease [Clostridiales bacterium]|nr:TRAP transporter large permease [Clostridiales bacterium]
MSIILTFFALFFLISLSVPVGLCIGGATIMAIVLFSDLQLSVIAQYSITGLDSFSMLAIPMFILAGTIMSVGGIAERLIDVAAILFGHIVGGLGAIVAMSSMFFGAISGSSLATVSAIGSIMVPQMVKKGYGLGYSAVFTACAGTIGAVIPPSIPLVIYGVVTGTSIGDLFLAGIVPGILIGIGLIIGNYFTCKKRGYVQKNERVNAKEAIKCIWDAKWALFAPIVILGGIYAGIFTPTEAAVVAVVYSVIVSVFLYKEMTLKNVFEAIETTAVVNGTTSYLLGISSAFAAYLSMEKIPTMITEALISVTDNKIIFLLLINILLLIIGTVIDNIPATIIIAPMLLPTLAAFGIDPVHFGIIMTVNLLIGLVTPPYGCSLFVASAVCNVKFETLVKNMFAPFLVLIISLILITYIPALSLMLL